MVGITENRHWTGDRLQLCFFRQSRCFLVVRRGAWKELATLWSPEWEEAAVIGDRRVLRLFRRRLDHVLSELTVRCEYFGFPPGESSKNRRIKQKLEDALLRAGFGRRCCVIGLGGGISLDLAGFVAATYLRGVPWVALPTSLLAQVDAGLGGKTAVDTALGKNLIGAFWQPRAILVDPALPASLQVEKWRDGLAEMVKHACIGDAGLFSQMERNAEKLRRPGVLKPEWLRRALAVKVALVQADELERAERAWLNFGHTVGHALEAASGFRLSHGKAVAAGMVIEARLAHVLCGLPAVAGKRLERLLARLSLWPQPLPPWKRVLGFMWRDKKIASGKIHFALPQSIGRMYRGANGCTLEVETEDVLKAWNRGSA